MSHTVRNYFRQHWRGIVNLLTIMAMVALVYALRHQIIDTFRNIQNVNYWVLLLIIPIQILSYDAYARMYRNILNRLGQPVSYRSMYRVALELTFVNHAFPSGGITGISYFGIRLKNYGVKAGTSTLLQLIKFILIFVSFRVLLALGLVALAIGNKTHDLILLFAGVLSTLTLVGTFLAAYIVGSKARISSFFSFFTRMINRAIHFVLPRHPETIKMAKVRTLMDDMHDNYVTLKGNFEVMRSSFLYALVSNICEVLTIYVVYIAFNEWVNIGAIILAYAIANFAGLVSVLPGGIGIYEALMTGVLAAAGVPASLSIPIVVMYRILSMAIQLIPGWFLYHKALQGGGHGAKA